MHEDKQYSPPPGSPDETLRFDRTSPAVEARVDDLLRRMTLEEKVGQLVQEHVLPDSPGASKLEERVRAGRIGSVFGTTDVALINHYQRVAVEESRLHLPLIVGNDIIHGLRTVFPIPLAESCTWNPLLLEQAARVAAEEAAATGTSWIFAPMVDVSRDPRWGRIAESAGEDPFLTMAMAGARVRGFQSSRLEGGRRIVACPKHYAAYGAAEAGRDYNIVDISERTLRDVYLPPFRAAFEAGAGSVMTSFNEIAGVPATANALILRTVLRDEWTWPGLVVSDYTAVQELIEHGIAADPKDAARLSILAGLDMDMVSSAYADHLADLVREGTVPETLVEDAARRVLRLKLMLGLFDQPYTDETLQDEILLRDDFRALALQVAQESMALLKNQGDLLPLTPGGQRIALIGPLADNRDDLLGCWSMYGQAHDVETVLDGVRAYLADPALLAYAPGCAVDGDAPADIPLAVAMAGDADVVIVALGEGKEMSGEAHSRTHLGLPGRQQELLDALAATGTPVIGVLMCGRPLVIPRMSEKVDALLVAWHGGVRTGRAVADIVFGTVSPSGKLTASWPRSEGQIPVYYAHKNTGRPITGEGTRQFDEPYKSSYIDEPNTPLFPFGFGLSYTTFEYRDLHIESPVVALDGTVVATATVRNTGRRAGVDVVQLYIRDVVASVTRPVKELKGFQRVALEPGEKQTVRFEIPIRELGFTGRDMHYTVEPGTFHLWIGPDSDSGLQGDFDVAPQPRHSPGAATGSP